MIDYWEWFLHGTRNAECRRAGWTRLFDWWQLVHPVAGCVLSWLVIRPVVDTATAVLLPLAGTLVGLSFAWSGSSQSLLQSAEIEKVSKRLPDGLAGLAYFYQNAILLILTTLVLWGVAGFGTFDDVWPTAARKWPYLGIRFALFTLASMAVREAWNVVHHAQLLLLARLEVRAASQLPAQSGPSDSPEAPRS